MDLNNDYKDMERFTLSSADGLAWTVRDNETGISIDFRKGLFNDTQDVHLPDGMNTASRMMDVARTLREIADWLAREHYGVAMQPPHKERK